MSENLVAERAATPYRAEKQDHIVIRAMLLADIPAICDMAERIWRKHYVPEIVTAEQIEYMLPRIYDPALIKKSMTDRRQCFWLMLSGETPIGYAAAEPRGDGGVWFLDKLYVDMDKQRSGLGAMLLNAVLLETKPSELTLRVNRKNHKAINFYFKHGFYIEGLDCLDIGGGFVMDDFLMRKFV
ncbi:MAG: GNAT family N-acetyltransferase [Rickettsiales bacterium]|jgi:ribosomal protein S18 acetylase RimI-like enzyme|nr:GNAT family N-acetyltransferase [Rickettsiales bacterium]